MPGLSALPGLPSRGSSGFSRIAWPGAAVGLAVAASLIPAYAGFCMKTGLGTVIDVGGTLLLGIVAVAISIPLVMLGLTILRRIPRRFVASIVVAIGLHSRHRRRVRLLSRLRFASGRAAGHVDRIGRVGPVGPASTRPRAGGHHPRHPRLADAPCAPSSLAGLLVSWIIAPEKTPSSRTSRRSPIMWPLWTHPTPPCRARTRWPRSSMEAARTAAVRSTAPRWISRPIASMHRRS